MRVRVKYAAWAILALAIVSFVGRTVQAQEWPQRSPTLVVPFVAGGGADVVARLVSAEMAKHIGRSVIIENRPGASAAIGVRAMSTSQPDGYTVGLLTDVMTVTAASGSSPVDMQQDLAYVGQIVSVPLILVASGKAPFKTIPEFVAYAKANPGKLTAASIGPTSTHHLGLEWLKALAGIDMLVVPYRGVAFGLTALVADEVQLMFMGSGVADDYVAAGRLNYLGVGSKNRMSKLPNVPSISEFGFPEFELVSWYGVAAPAKTPDAIVEKWSNAIMQSLADPGTKQKVESTGAEPLFLSGPQFARKVNDEIAKYAVIGRRVGMWK
ncbi:MAG: tripartite tricarboxylate transporter substrate binding protein [Hyphomicrobiales bacterium]|nr:tripartite tricarboxylate transporter substrate binding protein [Hyphomicrobiales bacterium]